MNKNDYQTMPHKGKLAKNLNMPLEALVEKIAPFQQDEVYFYVVKTVEYSKGRFYQTASAPNFQGDLITLCTCEHQMRSARDANSWQNIWVAGYTSYSYVDEHKLFYLMKIAMSFESHRDLWFSDSIPRKTKSAKAANKDKFGDIYQPKKKMNAPYSYISYLRPCKQHVHCDPCLWHKDIKYTKGYGGRSPALLVGDPRFSFLWDSPIVSFQPKIGRHFRTKPLSYLFPLLEE